MSPKELLYIEDALGHEKFLHSASNDAIQNLQDPELKALAQELANKHQEIFSKFYGLL